MTFNSIGMTWGSYEEGVMLILYFPGVKEKRVSRS